MADCHIVHPTTGAAPGVLIWPDIFGLRPAFRQIGTRLAESGYAVLVVNPFYRVQKAPTASRGGATPIDEVRPLAAGLSEATHMIGLRPDHAVWVTPTDNAGAPRHVDQRVIGHDTGEDDRARLEQHGMTCSPSRRGNCHGNAVIRKLVLDGEERRGRALRARRPREGGLGRPHRDVL